jgi:hypothetical protein
MRSLPARSLGALFASFMVTWLIVAIPGARSESGSDQLIVKFMPESPAGQALGRMDLAAIDDPAEDARLVEIAQAFGERIGIPLRLESLTSGRELLLAVDHEALAALAVARLRERDGVIEAAVVDQGPGSPRLTVAFEPGSAFATAVAGESRIVLGQLAGEGPSRMAVEAEVASSSQDQAILTLDLEALTSGLVEGLQSDPDVQYAQRNLQLRPFRADAERRG